MQFFLNHHSLDNIQKALSVEYVLMIEDDGKIIGTGSLWKNEIKRMFILPDFQRLGYGSLLLEKLEHRAVNTGCTTVVLAASLSAYSLYEKRGYTPVKYEKIITQKGQVLCYHIMSKNISREML